MKRMEARQDGKANGIKGRNGISKWIPAAAYLVIWAFAVLVFWCFTGEGDAMGYSLVFLWVIIPAATLIVSSIISQNNYGGKWKWLCSFWFGLMYMLAEYVTFSMANNIAFNTANKPELSLFAAGTVISFLAMGAGHLLYVRRKNDGS